MGMSCLCPQPGVCHQQLKFHFHISMFERVPSSLTWVESRVTLLWLELKARALYGSWSNTLYFVTVGLLDIRGVTKVVWMVRTTPGDTPLGDTHQRSLTFLWLMPRALSILRASVCSIRLSSKRGAPAALQNWTEMHALMLSTHVQWARSILHRRCF